MPAFISRLAAAAKTAGRCVNVLSVTVFVSLAGSLPSVAHDALPTAAKPNGWSYPFSCCSGYDCREVSAKAISEKPGGYVIEGTGEVVAYSDTRLKDSPDGEFHWCSVAGADDGRTICLFVPPRSTEACRHRPP